MREWTEQEEQEMIELAKQGDPRANYELSLWALRRSEEEPGEARWNRLAAKCLVKAAQAGYPPAQERMAELLRQSKEERAAKCAPEQDSAPHESAPREPVRLSDAREAAARRSQGPAPESTARRPGRRGPAPVDDGFEDDERFDDEEDGYAAPRRAARRSAPRPVRSRQDDERYDDEPDDEYDDEPGGGQRAVGAFSSWGEKQWRRMEIICVAICAILLVAIAVMIITSRGGLSLSGGGGNPNSVIPPAGDASAGTTSSTEPTQEPEPYPDEATIAAIQAADLEVYPEESDYVTVPTTATVKVDSQSLRLRRGPSTTSQPPICNMGDGTTVQVYAIKNNWSLVYYEGGEEGPVYGWCSSEYLIVTAGAADNSSVG